VGGNPLPSGTEYEWQQIWRANLSQAKCRADRWWRKKGDGLNDETLPKATSAHYGKLTGRLSIVSVEFMAQLRGAASIN
jgi:hypothetical protein